jgi:phosphoribosyl 1,2-cyclic phosphodiesterase
MFLPNFPLMISSSTFRILGSSSSGNCGLLITPESRILIDAGFSGKKICNLLDEQGLSIQDIHAVFLTHEHSDHAQGFRGLNRHKHITWICNRDTYEAISHPSRDSVQWSLFETGSRFSYRDLEVEAFSIPHDACDPVGYLFSWGGKDLFVPESIIAWVLDLGYITNLVREKIMLADTLVIEANYDTRLLEEDAKRPWSVKQRIQSRHGHLSNKAIYELLQAGELGRVKTIHLAHISKDCNSPQAIRDTFAPYLKGHTQKVSISMFNPRTECIEML